MLLCQQNQPTNVSATLSLLTPLHPRVTKVPRSVAQEQLGKHTANVWALEGDKDRRSIVEVNNIFLGNWFVYKQRQFHVHASLDDRHFTMDKFRNYGTA